MTKPRTSCVRPGKTQISLCICAIWSVFTDGMCLVEPPGYLKRVKREPLPYWVDVQADLSLCWSYRSFCRFCCVLAQLYMYIWMLLSAGAMCMCYYILQFPSRPRWLSWMRRPTGDQEVAGSTPAEVGNILSWRLIMKYFLRSFSPFRWFKKGSCQFLAKECAQYWLTA